MATKTYYFPTIEEATIYHGYVSVDIVDHYADINEAVADELEITRRYECEQKPRPKPKAKEADKPKKVEEKAELTKETDTKKDGK